MVQRLTRRLRALPLDIIAFRRQGILVRVRNTDSSVRCEAKAHRRARKVLSHGRSRKRHRVLSVEGWVVGW